MRVWLALSVALFCALLVWKAYAAGKGDLLEESGSFEELVEELETLEEKNDALEEELRDFARTLTRRERQVASLATSSRGLASLLHRLVEHLSDENPTLPSLEWFNRKFLQELTTMLHQLSDDPEQDFRATLMEWAGEDDEGRFLRITYYACAATDGVCVSYRKKTKFRPGDGTLAGYALLRGHVVAIGDVSKEQQLFSAGAHPTFTEQFPFRQLHPEQDYIASILCAPIKLRPRGDGDVLGVLSLDSNKPFFISKPIDKYDKFFTLLKPWLRALVFYSQLHHYLVGGVHGSGA